LKVGVKDLSNLLPLTNIAWIQMYILDVLKAKKVESGAPQHGN
jgi:hypothetical protein